MVLVFFLNVRRRSNRCRVKERTLLLPVALSVSIDFCLLFDRHSRDGDAAEMIEVKTNEAASVCLDQGVPLNSSPPQARVSDFLALSSFHFDFFLLTLSAVASLSGAQNKKKDRN